MTEQDSIRSLKGVGPKMEQLFGKLNIYTIADLLRHYPREYDVFEKPKEIKDCFFGEKEAIMVCIKRPVQIKNLPNRCIVTLVASDETGEMELTWFNMPFLRTTLRRGGFYVFRGNIALRAGKKVMEQPEIFTVDGYFQQAGTMMPLYSLTAGLKNKAIMKAMKQAFEGIEEDCREYYPEEMKNRLELCSRYEALVEIHFPKNKETLIKARRRLVFDEFFFFILILNTLKEEQVYEKNRFSITKEEQTQLFIERLPYTLTNAQTKVWCEIRENMRAEQVMARLIQGDVGSGKTILAFLAMLMAAENGYQSALMVPTEVLAAQHYESLNELLKQMNLKERYQPVLLTGSSTAKEKRSLYEKIELGLSFMVIGTHALIQEKVNYRNLALVITDEQHRFGVKQRELLTNKAKENPPHVLVMSATPIPRTLAIILYGDLDISVVDELPANRLPIKNCVVDTTYRKKAYQFLSREIENGRQAYVICPMIEESEGIDTENVVEYTEKLKNELGSAVRIAMLHGKMNPRQKNEIMQAFAAKQIQILVSTTVIEVGINVPNATVMMIENAERFGLAQLHQLRGRVGRGEHQSYCIFIQGKPGKETNKRLEILSHSNDGFYIASEDLKLRGPGDLFGIRQSGLMQFEIADIYQDAAILQLANEEAKRILMRDSRLLLPEHQSLREAFEKHWEDTLKHLNL